MGAVQSNPALAGRSSSSSSSTASAGASSNRKPSNALRMQVIMSRLLQRDPDLTYLELDGGLLLNIVACQKEDGHNDTDMHDISDAETGVGQNVDGFGYTMDDLCSALQTHGRLRKIKLETLPPYTTDAIPSDDVFLVQMTKLATTLGTLSSSEDSPLTELIVCGITNPSLHFRIVACLLRKTRHITTFKLSWDRVVEIEPELEMHSVALALRYHPCLETISLRHLSPSRTTTLILFPALLTLPKLRNFCFEGSIRLFQDYFTSPQWLQQLLLLPTLKQVRLENVQFTQESLQALSAALECVGDVQKQSIRSDCNSPHVSSSVTSLCLSKCQFSESGADIFAKAVLRHSTSLERLVLNSVQNIDASFFAVLAQRPNDDSLHTLVEMDLEGCQVPIEARDYLATWFESLASDRHLRKLSLPTFAWDEGLCRSLRRGLEGNAALKSLKILAPYKSDHHVQLSDAGWQIIAPFLAANQTIEYVEIYSKSILYEAVSPDTSRLLANNSSLREYIIQTGGREVDSVNFVLLLVDLRQRDHRWTTNQLEKLSIKSIRITKAWQARSMLDSLRTNYSLRTMDVTFSSTVQAYEPMVQGILKMNGAGRKYLIHHSGCLWRAVQVLLAVANNLDCLFLHLIENPTLCNRSGNKYGDSEAYRASG